MLACCVYESPYKNILAKFYFLTVSFSEVLLYLQAFHCQATMSYHYQHEHPKNIVRLKMQESLNAHFANLAITDLLL